MCGRQDRDQRGAPGLAIAAVRAIELRLTETIAPGQVFVPFHYPEANANQLTQAAFDPISREPNYKQSAVRVERAIP